MKGKFVSRYCGQCGRKQQMRLRADGDYNCMGCGGIYDGKPDEHGCSLHHDPERALQLKEREEQRQRRERLKSNRKQLRGGCGDGLEARLAQDATKSEVVVAESERRTSDGI